MDVRKLLLKELIKKGYSKYSDGRKVWEICDRSFLYLTPELAKSFLKIRTHPKYKTNVLEIETSLIKENSEKLSKIVGKEKVNVIDMGCGDGTKAMVFIEALKGKGNLRFCPVHISEYLVKLATENVQARKFKNITEYKPQISDLLSLYNVASLVRNKEYQKNIILLFGSILASFEIHDYLFNVSSAMFKGDVLIIGNGIRLGERFANLESYNHPLFEKWLFNLVKEIGFRKEELKFKVRFANGRVEGLFEVLKDKKLDYEGKSLETKKGDEIICVVLYKYYEHELKKFCEMYFREVKIMKDANNEYVLLICMK